MPWILQMLGFGVMLLGVAIALWVSVWLLIILFSIGVIAVIWTHLRDFLTKKGVLNPTFGVPPQQGEAHAQVTIVDAEFSRVDVDAEMLTKQPHKKTDV